MKKVLLTAAATLTLATVGLLVYGLHNSASAAQETITGDWTAKVKETSKGPMLWLTLTRDSERRKGWNYSSSDIPLQEFSGLLIDCIGGRQDI